MAGRFKAECLAILDQVEQMRVPMTITKHGRPVARVVPMDVDEGWRPTMGGVHLVAESDEACHATGESWDAEPAS